MKWLKQLFTTHREFVGDFIETGDELLSLIASNKVVSAEYDLFISKTREADVDIDYEAQKSSDALSGYGILIKPKAFIESLQQ